MTTRMLDDPVPPRSPLRPGDALSDEEVARRVLAGERQLFEILMRRYNRRLYRVARGIVGDDDEAEDVVQDAYVRAFHHLDQFMGRALFATWLTRIAVHEAMARARRRGRFVEIDAMPEVCKESIRSLHSSEPDPEQGAIRGDMRAILENAIDGMPAPYRLVLVLRDVEGLSTAAAAECLNLEIPAVKTRLHRARRMLRRRIAQHANIACGDVFTFDGLRCDRLVEGVLARIAEQPAPAPQVDSYGRLLD